MPATRRKKFRRVIIVFSSLLAVLLATVVLLANVFVEPVLRKRLHTLIVDGSDSLYTYTLGNLHVNFFGGDVGVHDLHIAVDSNRYFQLQKDSALPSLVMQLDINRAHIHGIGVFALLFGKRIFIDEISSEDADVKLNRFLRPKDTS